MFSLCLLLLVASTQAQSVKVVVRKGSVEVSGRGVGMGSNTELKRQDKIKIQANSLVLAIRGNRCQELRGPRTYSYLELEQILLKAKSYPPSALALMARPSKAATDKTQLNRGNSKVDLWAFAPGDSVSILSDSIWFRVGNTDSRLLSDIKIFRSGSKDTMFLPKSSLNHAIPLLAPGTYYWTYVLDNYSLKDEFLNVFTVPDPAIRKGLHADFQNFQDLMAGFSPKMKEELLAEYIHSQKLYLNP